MSESVRDELKQAMEIFQEDIRPVWKKEFVSLYCFLPWLVYFRRGWKKIKFLSIDMNMQMIF